MTFHPQYATNGFFYVNYTRGTDGATMIVRYHVSADPDRADSATATTILTIAQPLIRRRGITLVGIAVTNLENADAIQLTLPLHRHGDGALDEALDEVRRRFGTAAITRGVLLGRDAGWTMPMLPD